MENDFESPSRIVPQTAPRIGGNSSEPPVGEDIGEFEIQAAFADIQAALTRTIRRQSVAEVAKQRGFKLATTHPQTSWSSGEDLDV
jgi:hypothetical protein